MSSDKTWKDKLPNYKIAVKEKKEGKYNNAPYTFRAEHSGLINNLSVLSPRFHQYYKDFFFQEKRDFTIKRWRKSVKAISEAIGRNLIESTSGVYMDKLGYFVMLKYPDIPDLVYKLEDTFKMYDGGVLYTPTYFPIRRNRHFNIYTFNSNFSRSVTNEIYKKVYEDHKYRCAYTLVRGYAKNRRNEEI